MLSLELDLFQAGLDAAATLPAVRPGSEVGRGDVGAVLPSAPGGATESVVSICDRLFVGLAVGSEAHHELRNAVGEIVSVILPGVEGLSVRRDQILEVQVFDDLRDPRGQQAAGLGLVVMAVP